MKVENNGKNLDFGKLRKDLTGKNMLLYNDFER